MKTNKTENIQTINPFENLTTSVTETASRRLTYSTALIGKANELAQKVILGGTEHSELAQKVIDKADTADLLELVNLTIGQDTIVAEANILDGCSDDELGHLLESRRSDRSKAKKKGPATSMVVCKTYISSFIAELLVREKMGKAYTGQSGNAATYDVEELSKDQEALTKKVKSLQSKKCRLTKLAQAGDAEAQKQLDETIAEINLLNEHRVGRPKVSTTKVVIKSDDIEALRKTLEAIDPTTLEASEAEKLTNLLAKLA